MDIVFGVLVIYVVLLQRLLDSKGNIWETMFGYKFANLSSD